MSHCDEPSECAPVRCVVGVGVVHAHDDEDVLEVRADGFGRERQRVGLLEHDRHDVVADVTLAQQLQNKHIHSFDSISMLKSAYYA